MAVLIWIVRAIVILLVLRIVLRLLFGTRAPVAPPRPGGGSTAERVGGELVRDPQCGTYIPKTRAIVVGTGDAARYFCSAACRNAFEAALRTSKVEVRT